MGDRSNGRARLQLFGSPRLINADGRQVALPARAYLLTLFILISGRDHEVARAPLAAFLWPDAPNPIANLRQLIARIGSAQKKACVDLFHFDRQRVALNVATVDTDIADFQRSVDALSWENCETVLERFRGDLLEGADITESDLAAWLGVQRSRVRNIFVKAFADLLESPDARANPRTAETIATRLLEIDPYQETAYRSLMRSFAASGMIEVVAATFERCRALIERDLHTVPGQATIDLFKHLTAHAKPAQIAPLSAKGAALSGFAPGDPLMRVRLPHLVILSPPRERHAKTLWEIATSVLDDTIDGLSSLRTIPLIAPHTSWILSKGTLDDETIARFDIGYILQTALRRRGSEDALGVRLFDTAGRGIIWADTYPLAIDSLAGSHRALSAAITTSLADAVERTEMARHEREDNPQAYYWYLRGQRYLRFMDLPNVRRALKAFRTAVTADPGFAPAFAGSARATQRQWLVMGRGDDALLEEAEQIGARAVSLDHRDARGYREIALCNLYRRRWDASVENFAEAERLGPHHADLISDYGDALGHAGEPEKGLQKVERALELNPIPPDQYWWNAAGLHFQLRNYEAAIAAIGHMSDPLPALRIAAASWAYLGKTAEARKCASRFLQSYPDFRIDHWLSIVPDRNPDDRRHYEVGLKMAGFK